MCARVIAFNRLSLNYRTTVEISLQPQQQLFHLSQLRRSFLSSAADGERIHLSVCVHMCVYVCVSDSTRVIFLKYS